MKIAMRVVSFCHYLQGPACTQYLADMGADVIKIEPLKGAFERHWSGAKSYVEGVSAFLLAANRNKRSLAVDLKMRKGREIVLRLIDTADAVVENFRPGVLDRLGLGFREPSVRASLTLSTLRQVALAQRTCRLAAGPGSVDAGPLRSDRRDRWRRQRSGGGRCGRCRSAWRCIARDGILGAYVRKLQTGIGLGSRRISLAPASTCRARR